MKRLILTVLTTIFVVSFAAADGLEGKRIYVNPGHGGWGPNDRPAPTIPYPNLAATGRPDTCGFYESNTDLWKCEELAKRLRAAGAEVTMSRTKNGPYPWVSDDVSVDPNTKLYNRNLSEICEEVCAGGYDYFISVHSNAATDGTTTNYPLLLHKGYDNGTTGSNGATYRIGDSYERAETMWPYLFEAMDAGLEWHDLFSKTNMYIKGDITFYGSMSARWSVTDQVNYWGYLGVLKHSCAGFLSEGYFHTYQPARHRALNRDFCRQEGLRYYRGIAAYYEQKELETGCIMGVIKSETERIENSLYKYKTGMHDQWLPLNGATVRLYKGGALVGTYKVDNNYNGVFVFWDLEPGDDYTLDASCDGYKSMIAEYKVARTVKANETTYPRIYLEPAELRHYDEPEQSEGVALETSYTFREEFVDKEIAVLADKTVRRAIVKDANTMYVLAIDGENKSYLYLIDPETQAVTKEISTQGTQGDILTLSDISLTDDGVLVGCNYGENWSAETNQDAKNESATGVCGTLRFYYWEADDAEPTEWFTSKSSGNWQNANVGRSMAVTGTIRNGRVVTGASSIFGETRRTRLLFFDIENGEVSKEFRNQDGTNLLTYFTSLDYQFDVSPVNEEHFLLSVRDGGTYEIEANETDQGAPTITATASVLQWGSSYFWYAKHIVGVTQTVESDSWTGVALYDITSGIGSAAQVQTENTTLTARAVNGSAPMTAVVVDDEDMDVYVLRDQYLSKLTTKPSPLPAAKAVVARALRMEKTEAGYVFSFRANTDVTEAALLFYDELGDNVFTYPLMGVVEGDNSFTLTKSDIGISEGQTWTWAVRLSSRAVEDYSVLYEETERYTKYTGNLAFNTVDNSTESPYFGNVYVFNHTAREGQTGYEENGLFVYDGDMTLQNETAYGGNVAWGRPFRMGIDAAGRIYIPDWSDAHSGVYVANPANLGGSYTQLFQGERNSDGLFEQDGVGVGGSVPGLYVYGTGEKTLLVAYSEDTDPNNGLALYQLGQDDGTILTSWDKAPTQTIALTAQANTNGNVWATSRGVFVSQNRTYNHNEETAASLMFYDYDGNLLFNSAEGAIAGVINGSNGGGFAVSRDEGTLVMNDGAMTLLVFDVTYTDEAVTLALRDTYEHGIESIYQMNFDYQGNLICTGPSGLYVFGLPKANNTIVVPAAERYAISIPLPRYTITIEAEFGYYVGDGEYEEGEMATLEVFPFDGYEFVEWSDGNNQNPREVEVLEDKTYVATFVEISIPDGAVVTEKAGEKQVEKRLERGVIVIERGEEQYSVDGKRKK